MSDYKTMKNALREIATNSADPQSRRLAAAAANPARTPRPSARTCLVCETPTIGTRMFCGREHARQYGRQTKDRNDPTIYARYFEALRMRSEGATFAAIGAHFGVSTTRGTGLVWAAARALSRPENADRPEQALLRKVMDAGLIDVAKLTEIYGEFPPLPGHDPTVGPAGDAVNVNHGEIRGCYFSES